MKKILSLLLIGSILVGCGAFGSSITLQEAKDIALKEVDGEIVRSKKDNDDGRIYFEVDILKGTVLHEFEIDAKGRIASHDQENQQTTNNQSGTNDNQSTTNDNQSTTNDNQNTTNNNQNEKLLTADEASKIALNRVGGGTVIRNEYDIDDGIKHYEIEIIFKNIEYDISVHAITGEIISYDIDN